MQTITIIIPTHNRANALAAVWDSYVGDPLVKRIIVVNDGSTDNTKEVLENLIEHSPIPVKVIHHAKRQGVQITKMAGIAEADTEWVLFGEDDVWLGKNYINTLLDEAKKLGAKIIAGRIINIIGVNNDFNPSSLSDNETRYMDDIFDTRHFAAHFYAHSQYPLPAPFLHAVALVHSSVFTAAGFDTRYRGTAHREETDFYLTADAAGFSIYWTPATECYHLRGAISFMGGQRGRKLNWFRIEFWGFVNTWMFIRKHWPLLSKKYGFEKSPLSWFVLTYCKERILLYRERIFHGRISKTWIKE
jgi:glycosyltransferase involved in cell wall biosynthesis